MNRIPAGNGTYKKLAVQCSADTFVVNQSLVFRRNICSKNCQLLVAAKRTLTVRYYGFDTGHPGEAFENIIFHFQFPGIYNPFLTDIDGETDVNLGIFKTNKQNSSPWMYFWLNLRLDGILITRPGKLQLRIENPYHGITVTYSVLFVARSFTIEFQNESEIKSFLSGLKVLMELPLMP